MTIVKKQQIFLCSIAIIAVILIVIFSIPVQEKHFSELYKGDIQAKNSLLKFREHPLKSITYNGNSWEYIATGKGQKHLLFIHGMGGGYDIWHQQIEALKDEFNIISLTIPTVNSLAEATNGIIQILDAENIDRVNFVGTSMGGYIGQYFLSEHPKRLNSIVLGNTFPPNKFYREQNGKMRNIVPFLPEWLIMSEFRRNAASKVTPASENSQLVNAYLLEQYSGLMSKQQFIGRFDIVLEDFKVKSNAVNQSIPKLIIESDNDPLVTINLRNKLKETYTDAEVFTFSGKGHFPYLNRADKYNEVLQKFFINGSDSHLTK